MLQDLHLSILPKVYGLSAAHTSPLKAYTHCFLPISHQVSEILKMTIPTPGITLHHWVSLNTAWIDSWRGRLDPTALTVKHLVLGDSFEEAMKSPVSHPQYSLLYGDDMGYFSHLSCPDFFCTGNLSKGCDIMVECAGCMSRFIYFGLLNSFPQHFLTSMGFCNC